MARQRPVLEVYPGLDALASSLRHHILQHQNAAIARSGVFRIAVSAGAVPDALARAISTLPEKDGDKSNKGDGDGSRAFDLPKWEIFLADERAVPLDHPDSNFLLLRRSVLDSTPSDRQPIVHLIDTRYLDDINRLAAEYEGHLVSSFGSRGTISLPKFDLLILGCGPDGHACSLFPGHRLLAEKDAWVAAVEDSPKPPARRVTLTLPVVTNGNAIFFVVHGAEKAEMLRGTFTTSSKRVSTLINRAAESRVRWFVTEDAVNGNEYPEELVQVVMSDH